MKKGMKGMVMFTGIALIAMVLSGCAILDSSQTTDTIEDLSPESLIRFHVIANSDSDEDQLVKYKVRDEIVKIVAPLLAESKSLEESRQLLKEMEGQLLDIANTVLEESGANYEVRINHGKHIFPSKSYGRIILPGGEYEAVKIELGEAQGENWWCVLFPPICFVNVEESTTMTVDGKAGVPLDTAGKKISERESNQESDEENEKKSKVKFYFARFFQ